MIGVIIYIIIHLILMFVSIVLAKIAEDDDVIDDAEFWIVLSVIVPWGILVVLGAMFLAQHLIDWRDARRFHDRYDDLS